jgi:hypothetical protein
MRPRTVVCASDLRSARASAFQVEVPAGARRTAPDEPRGMNLQTARGKLHFSHVPKPRFVGLPIFTNAPAPRRFDCDCPTDGADNVQVVTTVSTLASLSGIASALTQTRRAQLGVP